MVKCVSILGSTGSIGRQTLDVISRLPGIRVGALTAGKSVERMEAQCRAFHPQLAVMATPEAAQALAEGKLDFNPAVRCDHHDHHGEGHSCGSHSCGSHTCG